MNIAAKKVLFIMRQAPHGTALAQEAFDVLLMASSFAHKISILFLGDGVFGLLQNQDTTLLGIKNFASAYKALPLYDINNIYISEQDLHKYNIKPEDLFLTTQLLTDTEIKNLMHQQDIIFNF